MFGALDTATSGATLSRVWLDAISDNVANVNTVRPAGEAPFRARLVEARALGTPQVDASAPPAGVGVEAIRSKGGQPQVIYDPDNPLADADGNVTRPVVDLGEEMSNLLVASRSYQANLSVLDRVRDTYQKALQIGAR